jgi:hypothetical protein
VLPGFGHAGMGGSIGWADPASGIAFGFVHNRLLTPMIFDQATFIGLGALLRSGAAPARRHGYHILPDLGAPYPEPRGPSRGRPPSGHRGPEIVSCPKQSKSSLPANNWVTRVAKFRHDPAVDLCEMFAPVHVVHHRA